MRSMIDRTVGALSVALAVAATGNAVAADTVPAAVPYSRIHVQLHEDARTMADWVQRTGDNRGAGFLIIDKKAAMLHVFDPDGDLKASSPVLLGLAEGDDTVPGIGNKPIADVLAHERTTPAGRFVAERGHNAKGVDVVWIDYEAGLSMHRVINEVPAERRLQRLASATAADNRISYGCVNVPAAFYDSVIQPMFADYRAMVYILPEHHTLAQVFGLDSQVAIAR